MYENVFKGVAASVGLQPVLQYGDRQLDPMLDLVRSPLKLAHGYVLKLSTLTVAKSHTAQDTIVLI